MSNTSTSNELVEAVKQGKLADVIAALDAGADIEAHNKFGSSGLVTAASLGYTEIVSYLLARGANIHVRAEQGSTPLHNARNQEIVWILLAYGASLEAHDEFGATPLHWSVVKPECLNVLLNWGAEVEAEDDEGYTPIWRAIDESIHESIVTLILRGASIAPPRVGTVGHTVYYNNFDIFLVLSKMLLHSPGLEAALKRRRPDVFVELIQHQTNNVKFIEIWNKIGDPMHKVSHKGGTHL